MTTRDVGDRIDIEYAAYAAGVASTATMALAVTDPAGAVTTPSIVFTAPNLYDASFTLNSAGVWSWVWTASGAVVDVQSGEVTAADPAPPAYVSLALLREAIGLASTDTSRDNLLIQALNSASRSVEQYCDGRQFFLDRTASVRVFSAGRRVMCTDMGERVPVDDIGSLAGLIVEYGDGTTYTALTDYETFPDNALAKLSAITAIVSPNVILRHQRKIRVTARWGWPEVPSAVEQATLLQAARLYRRKDSPEGVAGTAEWGLVRVPNLDPDVKALLSYLVDFPVA